MRISDWSSDVCSSDLPGKEDELRYTLASILPETKDSEFTWKDYQARNNNELLAIFGNFINRVVVLIHKYFEGKVPAAVQLESVDREVLKALAVYPAKIGEAIEHFRFREGLAEFMTDRKRIVKGKSVYARGNI